MRRVVGVGLILLSFLLCGFAGEQNEKTSNFISCIPSNGIVVGSKFPDLVIRNVEYNSTSKNIQIEELRGRWIVLDFWNRYCAACIKSFPKMNEFARKFKDDVKFVLIGREDPQNRIREMYASFQNRYNLTMTAAFDSLLMNQLNIQATPYIIVINPNGVIKAITSSLSEDEMNKLLNGFEPPLSNTDGVVNGFNPKMPLINSGNGEGDFKYDFRTMIGRFYKTRPIMDSRKLNIDSIAPNEFECKVVGTQLYRLYNLAYRGINDWWGEDVRYGAIGRFPVLEIADSAFFSFSKRRTELLTFSLNSSKRFSNRELSRAMISALNSHFGYNSCIEMRDMPYWSLTVKPDKIRELITKGGERRVAEGKMRGRILINVPMKELVMQLSLRNGWEFRPFIDESGIQENIDLDLGEADWLSFEDVKRCLLLKGILLVERRRPMDVIVITDAR